MSCCTMVKMMRNHIPGINEIYKQNKGICLQGFLRKFLLFDLIVNFLLTLNIFQNCETAHIKYFLQRYEITRMYWAF